LDEKEASNINCGEMGREDEQLIDIIKLEN
jgi:hypothetical protein